MHGITQLNELLLSMRPRLMEPEYVFCTVPGNLGEYLGLHPLAVFQELEGLTLLLEKTVAEQAGLLFSGVFKQITLTVHSSLQAVGLTAVVATKLADYGISANVIAAYYHDHVFVPADKAAQAMQALAEFNL